MWYKLKRWFKNPKGYDKKTTENVLHNLYIASKNKIRKHGPKVGTTHKFKQGNENITTLCIDSFKFVINKKYIAFFAYNIEKRRYIKLYCTNNGISSKHSYIYLEKQIIALSEYLGSIDLYLR